MLARTGMDLLANFGQGLQAADRFVFTVSTAVTLLQIS